MTRKALLSVALYAGLFMLVAGARALPDTLYPLLNSSNPATGVTNAPRETGLKGILYRFGCFDAMSNQTNTCYPLSGNGTVTFTPPGGGALTCAPGYAPAPGACSFVVGNFFGTGFTDTYRIFYNGVLPASTNNVIADVDGATGAAASTEAACTPATCQLTFGTGNATPRQNTSVEIVFDISGSMAQPAAPAGVVTRMAAVQQAAATFFNVYQPKAMMGDKIGAVFFSTTASAFPGAVPNFVAAVDPGQLGTVAGQVAAQTPTNWTAIGLGLQTADTSGFSGDIHPNPQTAVMLFTDGEQNVTPNVSVSGSQVQVGGTPYHAGTKVCPVTAGVMSAPGFALLQSIANAACGTQNAYVQNGQTNFIVNDLVTYFTQLIATQLQGDKYEISQDVHGYIGTDPVQKFVANSNDRSITLILSYDSGRLEGQNFKMIAPDGTDINARAATHFYGSGSVTELVLPRWMGKHKIPTAGTWKVVFGATNAPKGYDGYHMIAMVDNPSIATAFRTVGDDFGTGDPLHIRASLTDGGSPILNATVTAHVTGPDDGVGNIASTNNASTQANPHGDRFQSVGQMKIQALYDDPAFAALFGRKSLSDVTLLDNGSATALDATASDGLYNGAYLGAKTEGHYVFTFKVRGRSPGNGNEVFERTWKISLFARPKPSVATTPIRIDALGFTGGGISASLHLTPRDKFKNYLGPGYDPFITFKGCTKGGDDYTRMQRGVSKRGGCRVTVIDELNGSYQIRLFLTPQALGHAVLQIMGHDIKVISLLGKHVGNVL